MTIRDDLAWFKQQFAADLAGPLAGTPISPDLVAALAYQETGEIWRRLRHTFATRDVLRLCVGDTIDAPRRKAFPRSRAALTAVPRGGEMFTLAHDLLVRMGEATGLEVYQHLGRDPDRFVRAFGLFRHDLQHFKADPDFFLHEGWADVAACVTRLVAVLLQAVGDLGLQAATALTDEQSCFVAIVYDAGFRHFDARKGLKQGHFDGTLFYGEHIARFLAVAHTVRAPASRPAPAAMPAAAAPAAPVPSVVAIATREFDQYGGIDEGTQPLRGRIADYYEAAHGSRDLDPTSDDNAWSAAFNCFCMKKSGVTAAQFAFDMHHSVYVHAAIAHADAGTGVFRGHPIGAYAPRLGDIIHRNRGGHTFSFSYARHNKIYSSHAAIVVDFEVAGGVRYAVTIGGNELLAGGTGTVGKDHYALDSHGLLDQSRIEPMMISVIENKLAHGDPQGPGPYVVNVRTTLKLRGGPGPDFPINDSLANGTPLTVLQFTATASGRWALVDLKGDGIKDGYVFAAYLVPATA